MEVNGIIICNFTTEIKGPLKIIPGPENKSPADCKAQPRHASLGYPFRNTAAHTEATPTREGI